MGDCGRGETDKRRLRGRAWDRLGIDGLGDGDGIYRSATKEIGYSHGEGGGFEIMVRREVMNNGLGVGFALWWAWRCTTA